MKKVVIPISLAHTPELTIWLIINTPQVEMGTMTQTEEATELQTNASISRGSFSRSVAFRMAAPTVRTQSQSSMNTMMPRSHAPNSVRFSVVQTYAIILVKP